MFETKGQDSSQMNQKHFFASTHGAPTLVDFYTNIWLNKNIVIKCLCGGSTWWWWCVSFCWHGGIYFCQGIFWHVIKIYQGICLLAPIRKLMLLLTCSPNSNPLFPPIANEVSENLWTFWECWKTYFQPHWTLNLSSYWYVCTLLISFDPHCWFWNEKRFLNTSSMISLKNTLILF
jgi:hypothetical protein